MRADAHRRKTQTGAGERLHYRPGQGVSGRLLAPGLDLTRFRSGDAAEARERLGAEEHDRPEQSDACRKVFEYRPLHWRPADPVNFAGCVHGADQPAPQSCRWRPLQCRSAVAVTALAPPMMPHAHPALRAKILRVTQSMIDHVCRD